MNGTQIALRITSEGNGELTDATYWQDTDNSIIRPKTERGRTRKRNSLYDIYLCACESISILEIMNEK